MNINKIALLSSAMLISTPLFADTQSNSAINSTVNTANNSSTKTAPSYGDNPNLLKVLAVKTQEKVQSTAEKVGAATERGIAKIKPTVDNTWNGTKEYTSEQAVIVRDNTRQGIDTAVKKVKQTKENLVGSGGVPIERNAMSEPAPQNSQIGQSNTVQYSAPIQQNTQTAHAPAPVAASIQPAQPIQTNTPTTDDSKLNQNADTEIQRQSLPFQNNTNSNDDNAGLPR